MSIDWSLFAIPKVRPTEAPDRPRKGLIARLRARKARKDRKVFACTAERVAERDGLCRYGYDVHPSRRTACGGKTDPAHYGAQKRFKTRGQAPEIRHTTAGMLALCRNHHEAYDRGRLQIVALTTRGCDGPLVYLP